METDGDGRRMFENEFYVTKTGNMRLKNNAMKRLGKKIGGVHDARSMNDYEKFGFNVVTYEMVANVDMFGLSCTVFSRTFSIVLRPSRDVPACSRPFPCVF